MRLGKMAWRNLLRHKRRTSITSFSVAFGVLLTVTFTGSGDYSYTNMIDTSVTMGLGHLTIEPPGYNDSPTLAKTIGDADDIRKRVLDIPGITDAQVRIMGQAMFASGAKSVGGMFLGVHPGNETEEHNIFLRSITKGKMFAETGGREIVIGEKMAERLGLRLGKKLVYTVTDKNGEMVSQVSRVSGLFRTGEDMVDSTIVLLPIDRLRKTLHYAEQDASMVAVFIEDQRRADGRRLEIIQTIGTGQHEVLTWNETQAELAGLIAVDRASNYLLQFLIGLLIAAGIFNTLLMSVMERTREFGIMMAMGMAPSQVVKLVIIESFWIGVMGLVLGIVITAPWYIFMSKTGINLESLIGDDYSVGGVLFDPVLKIRLFKESVIAILTGVFGLTLLSGLYPAFRAGRIPPCESIKQD